MSSEGHVGGQMCPACCSQRKDWFKEPTQDLDVLALADVVDVLLRRRWPSRTDRAWARRRLNRMRDRYPDPLYFDGSGA